MAFDLTKPFIEKLLGLEISDFEVSAGCNPGDNVAGSLKAIKATSTKSGDKVEVVYKTFPPKEVPQYEMVKNGPFRSECLAYSLLIPTIQELVKGKGGEYISPMPKLYDFFNDDENDYLCLEDVRPAGYKMPSVFTGLNYPETSLAMKELAKFHAFSHFLIRQLGEQIFEEGGKFGRFNSNMFREPAKMAEFFTMLTNSVQNSIDILESTCGKPCLAKKMRAAIPPERAGDIFTKTANSTDQDLFPTLVHGDFWSNNFLIKYDPDDESEDGRGRPVGVKFVDFQFTRRGNIFEDLVYFLLTSTTPKFRAKHLTQVLFDYYDSFWESLKSINVAMPPKFSRGSLLDNFQKFSIPGLVHMTFAIPLQMGQPPVPPPQGEGNNSEPPQSPPPPPPSVPTGEENGLASDPIFATKMFAMGLRMMVENSPKALERLEEISEELLN